MMGRKAMSTLGVRIIVNDLGSMGNVHVYDSESGQELTGITDIAVHIPVGGPARATFTVLVDSIDVDADAEITHIDIRTFEEISRDFGLADK